MSNTTRLISSITICEVAGLISGIFTIQSIPTWYATLSKPFFSPPTFLFGPIWTILYFLMGISLYLVWSKKTKKKEYKKGTIQVFILQLAANFLWSVLFFGLHSITGALIDILFLWFLIFVTVIKFSRISRSASYLLIPYLYWVSFAVILNLFFAILN